MLRCLKERCGRLRTYRYCNHILPLLSPPHQYCRIKGNRNRKYVTNETTMNRTRISKVPVVLHEDRHVLIVDKPSGLLAQEDQFGRPSIVNEIKLSRPDIRYLTTVHRLDRNVSGVTILAKSKKAASRLSSSFRHREVKKEYVAVVHGTLDTKDNEEHDLKGRLKRDGRRSVVTNDDDADGTFVSMSWTSIGRGFLLSSYRQDAISLLRIDLHTGFKHQIRCQLADVLGTPIVGDTLYGAPMTLYDRGERRLGLHALSLRISHPVPSRFPSPLSIRTDPPLLEWESSLGVPSDLFQQKTDKDHCSS